MRALAMVAEIVHGAPYRFTDPARFSFAHGGKDRHPFPVPLRVYDETIKVMKAAVQKAKLGRDDMLSAVKRLDDEARRIEGSAAGPPLPDLVVEERRLSHSFSGRSVFGWEPAPEGAAIAKFASGRSTDVSCRNETSFPEGSTPRYRPASPAGA